MGSSESKLPPGSHNQGYGGPSQGYSHGQGPPPPYQQPQHPSQQHASSIGSPVYGQPPSVPPRPEYHGQHHLHPRPLSQQQMQQQHQMQHHHQQLTPHTPQLGMFPPSFFVFLELERGLDLCFKIGHHASQPLFIANLKIGTSHDALTLYRVGLSQQQQQHCQQQQQQQQLPVANSKSVGLVGTKFDLVVNNTVPLPMKSSDLRTLKFDVAGAAYKWEVEYSKRDASAALGYKAKKAWKLVRTSRGGGSDVLAMFGEAPGYSHASGQGKFMFMGEGASGQLGAYWADVAVVSFLTLWQVRAVKAISSGVADGFG